MELKEVNVPYDNIDLWRRIALLEGQKSGAEAELNKLYGIPCPSCHGSCNIERIEGGATYSNMCKDCQGTGKAVGKRPY